MEVIRLRSERSQDQVASRADVRSLVTRRLRSGSLRGLVSICLLSMSLTSSPGAAQESVSVAQLGEQTEKGQTQTALEPARYAMFWSESNTWIVDTLGGALFKAPALLALSPEGHILEYRLNIHAERVKSQRPFGDLYRWVSLDRHLLNGQHHDQLTYHFTPDQLSRETHDEHQILQFTGEYVTLIRWFYHQQSERDTIRDTTVYTLALDGVQALPELKRADEVLSFTRRIYPQLIPQCLKADTRVVRWELGGQREVFWITLAPQLPVSECPSQLSALRLSPSPARASGGPLTWRGETLYYGDEALYGGVVDALLDPRGEVALTLEGAPRDDEGLFTQQINQLYEQPLKRYLSIWRAHVGTSGERGRHVSFPKDVALRRLDGARWLSAQSPMLELLGTHFTSVNQSCFHKLSPRIVDRYRKPKRPAAGGHLCAVQTRGRVWEGHHDLSAGIVAQVTSDLLYIDLWVSDPDRTSDDLVRLWVGPPQDPVQITLTPRGVIGQRAIRAGVKLDWREMRSARDPSRADPFDSGGYRIRLTIPRSLVRSHLSLAIDDHDLAIPSASQRLWVIGQPRSEVVGSADQPPKPEKFETL